MTPNSIDTTSMENCQYLLKLNLSIPCKPEIQLLVIYATEMCTYLF